jgi:enolase
MNAAEIEQCDEAIKDVDGTANFSRIGGNTASALSIAIARAAAHSLKVPLYRFLATDTGPFKLPLPLGNIIGGGAHAAGPTPDMQEHLVLPVSATRFKEAVRLNTLVHEETGRLLAKKDKNFTGGSDDERAWAADLNDYQALEVLSDACQKINRETGAEFRLGLDLAADRLWDNNQKKYVYSREGTARNTDEQLAHIEMLIRTFNLGYIEDAFHSNDYEAFAELNKSAGQRCLVCGDDLLATNMARTAHAVKQGSVNAMIIKVNQIGTLTDARKTTEYAQSQRLKTIISHRSGETEDAAIAHVGVGWQCAGIKTGVLGGERLAKLNELIRIEEELGKTATLARLPIPGSN